MLELARERRGPALLLGPIDAEVRSNSSRTRIIFVRSSGAPQTRTVPDVTHNIADPILTWTKENAVKKFSVKMPGQSQMGAMLLFVLALNRYHLSAQITSFRLPDQRKKYRSKNHYYFTSAEETKRVFFARLYIV